MQMLDLAKLRATAIATEPFPHIIVPGFVPPQAFDLVHSDLPAMKKGGSFPIGALRFGSNAKALLDQLQGPEFRAIVAEKFGLDLADAPTMLTLRGMSRDKDGRIHTDSKSKRVTILLYLNPRSGDWADHNGCLRLLRGPESLDNFADEVPPVEGALLVFPNGPTAWHGHKQFIGKRYVVQMNYMANDNAAASEIRRHKISALVKRIF
jgi:SM-20-related protein